MKRSQTQDLPGRLPKAHRTSPFQVSPHGKSPIPYRPTTFTPPLGQEALEVRRRNNRWLNDILSEDLRRYSLQLPSLLELDLGVDPTPDMIQSIPASQLFDSGFTTSQVNFLIDTLDVMYRKVVTGSATERDVFAMIDEITSKQGLPVLFKFLRAQLLILNFWREYSLRHMYFRSDDSSLRQWWSELDDLTDTVCPFKNETTNHRL